ncbi:MAG: hypothetical protein GX537_10300, partial [Actinobacteria bacterium]|nr:hypothetical protein [Actinomycetota bacterium]
RLAKLRQATVKDSGRLAEYLCSRGLSGRVPAALRLHPALDYFNDEREQVGTYPAMLAKVVDAAGYVVAAHRTYLDPIGPGKADVPSPKKLTTPTVDGATSGAAVRLFEPAYVLALAEGIETALAVHEATGTPTWSTVSAGGLEAVQVPAAVRRVELWADLDESGRGREAAEKAAARLTAEGRDVRVLTPPRLHEDGATGTDWLDVLVELGPEALTAAQAAAEQWQPPAAEGADAPAIGRVSTSDRLVALGRQRFEFGVSTEGEPFGVPREGPRIARMLRGQGGSLRADLAAGYLDAVGKVPNQSALADAVQTLEGLALRAERVPLHVRFAAHDGATWLDLGDEAGHAVRVSADGWTVEETAPVLFRRTALTGLLPVPVPGDLGRLRDFLNVTDEGWALLVGCLVSTYHPAIPHPVLVLTGEQGSGKTSAARQYIDLVDPSPAPLRTAPRDIGEWVTVAAGSAVVGLDNVSVIPAWLSDALCRAVTGDGFPRRQLYTDSELVVSAFRRAVVLNGIDLGALSGDLVDRACFVDLQRISYERRRLDAELARDFAAARPALLGGLLDLVAATLRYLPHVRLEGYPRMADHAKVLAALDMAADLGALPAFLRVAGRAFEEAVEGDAVAAAVHRLVAECGSWAGELAELLDLLTERLAKPDRPPKAWPADAARLSGRLKRAAPALRAVGVAVELDQDEATRHRTASVYQAEKVPKTACLPCEACSEQAEQAEIRTFSARIAAATVDPVENVSLPSLESQAAFRGQPAGDEAATAEDGCLSWTA